MKLSTKTFVVLITFMFFGYGTVFVLAINLNTILEPFGDNCLILLIHFPTHEVDNDKDDIFYSTSGPITTPVVQTKARFMSTKVLEDTNITEFVPGTNLSGQHTKPLNCAISFYLYPSIQYGEIKAPFLPRIIDTIFINNDHFSKINIYYDKLSISPFLNFENTFQILVTKKNDPSVWLQYWALDIIKWKRDYDVRPSRLLIITTGLSNGSDYATKSELQVNLICDLCVPCYIKFIPYKGKLSVQGVNEAFSIISKDAINRVWRVRHSSVDVQQISIYDKNITSATKNGFKYLYFTNIKKEDDNIIDLILFKTAFSNSSMIGIEIDCGTRPSTINHQSETNEDDGTITHYIKWFQIYYDPRVDEESNAPFIIMDKFQSYFINIGMEGVEFVTCYPITTVWTNFQAMAQAFDILSWTCIAFCGILLCLVMSSGHYVLTSNNVMKLQIGNPRGFFDTLLHLGFATLLEQSNHYSKNVIWYNYSTVLIFRVRRLKNPKSKPNFIFGYILCTAWILGAILLSNSYRSEYVKTLTVPPTPKTFTTFDQLFVNNFKIYTIPFDVSFYSFLTNHSFDFDIQELSIPHTLFFNLYTKLQFRKSDRKNKDTNSKTLEKLANVSTMLSSYNDKIMNGNALLSHVISSCEERVAFASWSNDIEKIYMELKASKNTGRVVSRSLKALTPVSKGWVLVNVPDASIFTRLSSLFHSGIGDKWYKEVKEKQLGDLKKAAAKLKQTWRKLDLSHNFFTIILVWLIGIFASVIWFILEFVK